MHKNTIFPHEAKIEGIEWLLNNYQLHARPEQIVDYKSTFLIVIDVMIERHWFDLDWEHWTVYKLFQDFMMWTFLPFYAILFDIDEDFLQEYYKRKSKDIYSVIGGKGWMKKKSK